MTDVISSTRQLGWHEHFKSAVHASDGGTRPVGQYQHFQSFVYYIGRCYSLEYAESDTLTDTISNTVRDSFTDSIRNTICNT